MTARVPLNYAAVGATWLASKTGGLNIKKSLPFDCAQGDELVEPQPREISYTEVAVRIFCDLPSRSWRDEGRCLLGRNGYMHQEDHRGMGAGIWGKVHGDKAGKDQLLAGMSGRQDFNQVGESSTVSVARVEPDKQGRVFILGME